MKRLILGGLLFGLLLPFFFIFYRLFAFHTFPFDSYYEYVLALDGRLPISVIDAPGGYRIGYYGPAFWCYKYMPAIPLSKLEGTSDPAQIKALQALAFTSYLYLCSFVITLYYWIRKQTRAGAREAAGFSALILLWTFYAYPYGVDALYFFYMTLTLLACSQPRWWAILLLISPFFNEKIALVWLMYSGLMWLTAPFNKARYLPLIGSTAALGGYFIIRNVVQLPVGLYGYQTDLSQFWTRIQLSLPVLISFKGFYTNWMPPLLLTAMSWVAWRQSNWDSGNQWLHPVIAILPWALFITGMFVSSDYGIGRLAMHALPFFVLLIWKNTEALLE